MSDAVTDLDPFVQSLSGVLVAGDADRFKEYLRGRHLPAVGGDSSPAEILGRALEQLPEFSTTAQRTAQLLARIVRDAAFQVREEASPLDAKHRSMLLGALQLASSIPAKRELAVALTVLLSALKGYPESKLGEEPFTVWLALWRALARQQVDDSLENEWMSLLAISANEWTPERRTLLLEAWRGLLRIPPDLAAQQAGEVIDFERVERGLLKLQESVRGREMGPKFLRYALDILSSTFPRSSDFWGTGLSTRIARWPAELKIEAYRLWPAALVWAAALAPIEPLPLFEGVQFLLPKLSEVNSTVIAGPDPPRLTNPHFQDFVLQLGATWRGGFRARVLRSPFGEGEAGFALPRVGKGSDGSYAATRNLRTSIDSSLDAQSPSEIGTELYRAVFRGQVRTLLDKSRDLLERSTGLGLRLNIKIDPSNSETGVLADLPWELLNDETEHFLALSRETSIVRYLDVPRPLQPIPLTPPLRILAVGASPLGLPPLDFDREMRDLADLNRGTSGVEVRFLPHASAATLRESLSTDTFHVLHFMGHGTFDPATGEGMLAFEAADGSLDLVSGKALAAELGSLRLLGVVVLNACDTARARYQGGANLFRGVSTALVLGGVPAVVAMQRPISDRAAIGFSRAFYRHLARGDSIDEALTEGRQAIHSDLPEAFEWAIPVLFLRISEGNVFVARPESSKLAL